MQITVCDKCKNNANENVDLESKFGNEDGEILINLLEKDWCDLCAQKAKNRLTMIAHEKLKNTRKKSDAS